MDHINNYEAAALFRKFGSRLQPAEKLEPWVARRLLEIMQGKDRKVVFEFREIRMPRGIRPHPPHSDRLEMRKTVSIEFRGRPYKRHTAHIFEYGSIVWKDEKHQQDNQRMWTNQRLAEIEGRYPWLAQTVARTQAYRFLLDKLHILRNDESLAIRAKEAGKAMAVARYEALIEEHEVSRRRVEPRFVWKT